MKSASQRLVFFRLHLYHSGLKLLKENYFIIAILFLCLGACLPIKNRDARSTQDIIMSSKEWELVDARSLSDGGSIIFSFKNENGEFINLWEDNSIPSKKYARRYYLLVKDNISDGVDVEIKHGTLVENQILEIIKQCSVRKSERWPSHMIKATCDYLSARLKDRGTSVSKEEGEEPTCSVLK